MESSLSPELIWRACAFAVVVSALMSCEVLWPRRQQLLRRRQRWPANFLLLILDAALIRVLFPLGAAGFAVWSADSGWGLLNHLPWLEGLELILALVFLDLSIYAQHRLMHRWPWLWRWHRVHHLDGELDVSSGGRFHPGEILISMVYKLGVIAVLGPAWLAVLIFEIQLNAASMFSHANLSIPARADRLIRQFIVTPDMHRVHHSVVPGETHSNFGFTLSIWDRLFGTYVAQPAAGHVEMELGLPARSGADAQRLGSLLAEPFRSDSAAVDSR